MTFSLREKAQRANEILKAFGKNAVQIKKMGNDDGKSRFTPIGYKSQYLIDAMNEAFGTGKWKHLLHDYKIDTMEYEVGGSSKSRTAVTALVSLQFFDDQNTMVFETGTHAGGSFVVHGALADGIKGAITDAIGKSLSLLSIGNEAYRGTLECDGADTVVEPVSNSRFKTKPKTSGGGFKKPGNSGFTPKVATTTTPPATPKQETKPTGGNGSDRFSSFSEKDESTASFAESGLSKDFDEVSFNGQG